MSIADAVLTVAENMEKDANSWENGSLKIIVSSYARELRSIVKAAEVPFLEVPTVCDTCGGTTSHQSWCEGVKRRRDLPTSLKKEVEGNSMVEVVGGSAGDEETSVLYPIDPKMPVGAKTAIGTEVYILQSDGKLHYCEEETKKFLL